MLYLQRRAKVTSKQTEGYHGIFSSTTMTNFVLFDIKLNISNLTLTYCSDQIWPICTYESIALCARFVLFCPPCVQYFQYKLSREAERPHWEELKDRAMRKRCDLIKLLMQWFLTPFLKSSQTWWHCRQISSNNTRCANWQCKLFDKQVYFKLDNITVCCFSSPDIPKSH